MSYPLDHSINDWSLHAQLDHQQPGMNLFVDPAHEVFKDFNLDVHSEMEMDYDHEELPMIGVDAILTKLIHTGESGLAPSLPSIGKDDTHKDQEAQVQKFYPGRQKCKCCVNWVEKRPQRIPDEAQEKYNRVAIQVYYDPNHSKETIGNLKIGGTEAVQGKIKLYPPFQDLFFAYAKIIKAHGRCEKNSEEEKHINVLREVTDELISETASNVKDLQARGLVTWETLWTLYKKGTMVVCRQNENELLYEVTEYNSTDATVKCRNIQFDGTNYGFKERVFQQTKFHGAKNIRELDVYPIWYHNSQADLERTVLERSAKLLSYHGMFHAEFGEDFSKGKEGEREADCSPIRQQIVIDPYAFCRFGPGFSVNRLTSDDPTTDKLLRQHFVSSKLFRPSTHHISKNKALISSWPYWLLLLSPFVMECSLEDNNFRWFYVNSIHPVNWNDRAFKQVVFAEESKDLLLTLVKGHKDVKLVSQDIIPGRGNGFVVLLTGPSGTGKTLTAEALAEEARMPLLRFQVGSLGIDEAELEAGLEMTFDLAAEWNALLLIDDVDALLASNDRCGKSTCTSRSSLVRILMKSIENYSGILFFTAKNIKGIDEALVSRVDMHFEYSALDRHARSQLLGVFIESIQSSGRFTQSVDLTDREICDLARWELNGRELKNVAKIASRMCSLKKEKLSIRHFEMAIQHTSSNKYKEPEKDDASDPPQKRARIH